MDQFSPPPDGGRVVNLGVVLPGDEVGKFGRVNRQPFAGFRRHLEQVGSGAIRAMCAGVRRLARMARMAIMVSRKAFICSMCATGAMYATFLGRGVSGAHVPPVRRTFAESFAAGFDSGSISGALYCSPGQAGRLCRFLYLCGSHPSIV
jgi:hypothetical protein